MGKLSSPRVVGTLLLSFSMVGCGSTPPPASLPTNEPAATGSYLVDERLPEPQVREPGPVAVGGPVLQLTHQDSLMRVDISPDGRLALIASYDGRVSVLDFETGATRLTRRFWVSAAQGGLMAARFDATATRVVLYGAGPPLQDALLLWDLLTDTVTPGHVLQGNGEGTIQVSRNGSMLVVLNGVDTEVRDSSTLALVRLLPLMGEGGDGLVPHTMWLSPSTSRLLATDGGVWWTRTDDGRGSSFREDVPQLDLFDTQGALVSRLRSDASGFRALGFRPTGGMLMTLTSTGVVQLRHPETGAVLHQVVRAGNDAQWSREGELLFVQDQDTANLVHFVDPASGAVRASVEATWPLSSVRRADGRFVAFSLVGREAFLDTGDPARHPLGAMPEADGLDERMLFAITPDGKRAIHVFENALHLLDLEAGRELAVRTPTYGSASVWGGMVVPGVGAILTMREQGILFRVGIATPVHCAGAGAQLHGTGAGTRVVSGAVECGLDDAERPERGGRYDSERGNVQLVSDDGSARVVSTEAGDDVMVEDVRTGRVRMHVPAANRTVPDCADCAASYSFSPNGALLFVYYSDALPLTVFDARTGRRLATIPNEGRYVEWIEYNADASVFSVRWESESRDDDSPLPDSAVVVYDRRGRELARLSAPNEAGARGAAFSATHGVVYFGARAQVFELRGRAVASFEAPASIMGAAWHGTTLRVEVDPDEPSTVLYALGATTPYFQTEGAPAFSADLRFVFRCRDDELERIRVEDQARTSLGACLETPLFPSDDGRFVAQPMGDQLRFVREDGVALRLAALETDDGLVAYAVEEATGRFVAFGAGAENAPLRYRQAGPGTSAALVSLSEAAGQADPQVIARFFGLTAPEQPVASRRLRE